MNLSFESSEDVLGRQMITLPDEDCFADEVFIGNTEFESMNNHVVDDDAETTNQDNTNTSLVVPTEETVQPEKNRKRRKEETTSSNKRWKCIYEGCTEGPKTHYNCYSHVWDVHLKNIATSIPECGVCFKATKDRSQIKLICENYIVDVGTTQVKRRKKLSYQNLKRNIGPTVTPNQTDLFLFGDSMNSFPQNETQTTFATQQSNSQPLSFNQSPFLENKPNDDAIWQMLVEQQNLSDGTPPGSGGDSPENEGQISQFSVSPAANSHLSVPFDGTENVIEEKVQMPQKDVNSEYRNTNCVFSPTCSSLSNEDFMKVVQLGANLKRLHVYGEVFAENGFLQRSDERFKTDIKPIKDSLEKVSKLVGKSFRYKQSDSKLRVGFIAQELREIIPEVVFEDENGYLSVDIPGLIPFVVEALKEVHSMIAHSKNERFVQLDKLVNTTLSRIDQISSDLEIIKENHNNLKLDIESLLEAQNRKQFRYRFVFLPPLFAFIAAVLFAVTGIILVFLDVIPFFYVFFFTLAVFFVYSIFAHQRKETIRIFRKHTIKLYFSDTMFLNWLIFASIFITGYSLSTIMGYASLFFTSFFLLINFIYGFFAMIFYKRFAISFRVLCYIWTIFLALAIIISSILFTSQPFACTFSEGNSRFDVTLDHNHDVGPFQIERIPWNCQTPFLTSDHSLPKGVELFQTTNPPPYIFGRPVNGFEEEFEGRSYIAQISLQCHDHISVRCGKIVFSWH